jgi:hypothetical protein
VNRHTPSHSRRSAVTMRDVKTATVEP